MMKTIFPKKNIKYDGVKCNAWQTFQATDSDAEVMLNAGLVTEKDCNWVGEGKVKPITELRDYFGPHPPFVSSGLPTEKPVDVRMTLFQARGNFDRDKSADNARILEEAVGVAWATQEISTEEMRAIYKETREAVT